MKKTVHYCDRCAQEQKETVAATMVWIRTAGMPHVARFDVCLPHLEMIMGATPAGPNGARAPQSAAPERKPLFSPKSSIAKDAAWTGKSKVYQAVYDKLLPYVEKTPIFTTDDLSAFFGGKVKPSTLSRPVARLLLEKRLERPRMGVYMRAGFAIIPPTTEEEAVARCLKIIRTQPSIRSTFVAAKAGIARKEQWKRTRDLLREQGVRTKGGKSAMRMYPPKA